MNASTSRCLQPVQSTWWRRADGAPAAPARIHPLVLLDGQAVADLEVVVLQSACELPARASLFAVVPLAFAVRRDVLAPSSARADWAMAPAAERFAAGKMHTWACFVAADLCRTKDS